MDAKIFVINLDRDSERLAHMERELEGTAFERFPAVDGAAVEGVNGLTRFEVACLASHQALWRRLLAGDEAQAVVLEDDVHLMPGFRALIADTRWVPRDAHAVKLDTYFQSVWLGPAHEASGGRRVARLFSRHESSAAYLVTRAGAELYLRLTTPPRLPADYSIFPRNPRRLGLTSYQLAPAVAVQDHLLPREQGGRVFTTAMAGGQAERTKPPLFRRMGREAKRLAGQAGDMAERAYVSARAGARAKIVGIG